MKTIKILALGLSMAFASAAVVANEVYVQHNLDTDVREVGAVMATSKTGYVFVGADTSSWAAVGYGIGLGDTGLAFYTELGKYDVADDIGHELVVEATYSLALTSALDSYVGAAYVVSMHDDVSDVAKALAGLSTNLGNDFTLAYNFTYERQEGFVAGNGTPSHGPVPELRGVNITGDFDSFEHAVVISKTYKAFTPYVKYTHYDSRSAFAFTDDSVTIGLSIGF